LGLASTITYQNNKAIKKVKSSKAKFILHCEINHYHGFPIQASWFYDNLLCVSLLKPYHASTIPRRMHDSLPPIKSDSEHEYEMEDILDSRIFNSQFQYFVHWHGYGVSECTWEPMKNLLNAMEKMHEFHQQYPNKCKSIPCGIRS